ncbi:MAG: hypothetical protein ACSLFK_15805 [Gemmatimonadaceae bacterium]
MPFDLSTFSLLDTLQCGRGIRAAAAHAESIDEAASGIVGYLYSELRNESAAAQRPALVRFYKTQTFGSLEPRLKSFALSKLGRSTVQSDVRCLTLLATAGQEPEWCDPRQSVDHQAIPLPSESIVENAPMIAQLIRELGLAISDIVSPDPSLIPEKAGRTYNVFHVPEALGSPYIPAQAEFVERYGIRSVIGFGGLLPDGELFAVIIFARGPIPEDSASRFRNIALDVKAVIHPFARPEVAYRPGDLPD